MKGLELPGAAWLLPWETGRGFGNRSARPTLLPGDSL